MTGSPKYAAKELTNAIWPAPRRRISGSTPATVAIAPSRLTASTAFATSQFSGSPPLAAALLTPAFTMTRSITYWVERLRQGIAVNVVMPGFVRTPMSDRFPGAKPFLMQPERAASLIRRGLERNRARIAFPGRLAFAMWLLSVLPAEVSQWMVRTAGFDR